MTFKKFVTVAIIAGGLISTSVRADDKPASPVNWTAKLQSPVTKDVKAACEAKDAESQAYCYGILMGLYDSNFYLSDAMNSQGLCIPADDTPAQMRDAFLDMTNKRSDQLLGPISIFYYMAMQGEFPCTSTLPQTPTKTKK